MDSVLPLISILLPAFNGAASISRAIESVGTQTCTAWELIVIDDGSTDATAEIVDAFTKRDPRIVYVRNETNIGIQKTLNKGLHRARGKYVARIDDDDAWIDTGKLEAQYSYMAANPDCVLVGTGTVVVDEAGTEIFRFLSPETDAALRRTMLLRNSFTHSSVFFSLSRALEVGGYGEGADTRHVEDYDLWLRLGKVGTLANLSRYSVAFTKSSTSLSGLHKSEQFRKNAALIRKYKDAYPGFVLATVRGFFLISLYRIFSLFPKRIQDWLIAWDKK